MVIVDLSTYNNLQFLINFIGGCGLPTKCIIVILINISNDDDNVFKTFITLSRFCSKLAIFPLSGCWHVVPPLMVSFYLIDMVQQW